MTKPTSAIDDSAVPADESGTSVLFWGWVVVTVLNLGMVTVSLALFAP